MAHFLNGVKCHVIEVIHTGLKVLVDTVYGITLKPFKRQPHKIVKHTLLPSNYLSVFDHFVGLVFKELTLGVQ